MAHVSPTLRRRRLRRVRTRATHAGHDPSAGMTGMVLGITVLGPKRRAAANRAPQRPPRAADARDAERAEALRRCAGVRIRAGRAEGPDLPVEHVPVPGPTLVLKRGEPVEITLVNRLPEGDRDPLARHGARQLLRRRARLERRRPACHAAHRAGRIVRRPLHAAAHRHVHVSHPSARQPAADLRAVRRDAGRRTGRDVRRVDRPCVRAWDAAARSRRRRPCSTASASRRSCGRRAHAPRAADQHHAGRHLLGHAADERGAGDVASADQGWRAAAARPLRSRGRRSS